MATKNPEESTALATIPPEGKYLPAMTLDYDWREVVRENIGSQGIDRFALPRLKVPTGGGTSWMITDEYGEEKLVKEFVGIPIHWGTMRAYWPGEFNEGNGEPPTCSSDDGIEGHGTPGGDCAGCQFNQYNTAATGKGKACKEVRAVFVLPEDALFPTYIQIPPTSLKNFRAFMVGISSKGIMYWKTKMSFKLEAAESNGFKYAKVVPTLVARQSEEFSEKIREYRDEIRPALDPSLIFAGGDTIDDDSGWAE